MDQFFQRNPEMAFGFLGGLCVVVLIALIVTVFFLLSMQRALTLVAPRNRVMEPGMVWLNLIPCLNLVWQFMIAIRIPDSLKNEFKDRRQDDGSDYGKALGVTYCIVGIGSSIVGNGLGRVPEMEMISLGISSFISLINVIIGILFWIKIVGYANQLASDDMDGGGRRRALDEFDDDDDDYRRRKRRSDSSSEGIQEADGF